MERKTVYSPWYDGVVKDGYRKGKISFRRVETHYGTIVYEVVSLYTKGWADRYTETEAIRDLESLKNKNGKLILSTDQGQKTSNFWAYYEKNVAKTAIEKLIK